MSKLIRHLSNLPGWRTNRKIVVIESDDWGSIRMPSLGASERLRKKGLNLGKGEGARYNKFDTLASSADLSALYETLSSFKDALGRHPVFTVVSLVANPDFDKIKADEFNQYYWEPFTRTLERYGQADAWSLWQEGKKLSLFWPEFHGREHLNVAAWLRALQAGDHHTLAAFQEGCWGIKINHPMGMNYQAAFDLEQKDDLLIQKQIIKEGLQQFKQLHTKKAQFFVPPNGPFNNQLQLAVKQGGVAYLSTAKIQKEPQGAGRVKKRFHYLGQKSKYDLLYLTRNAFFEPSDTSKDWISSCLKDIELAFMWNKPAVISTHRVNYISGLDLSNRDRGLRQLKTLLKKIIIKWPDVEFMTSNELGNIIKEGKRSKNEQY